jgi:hypothetical protein
MSDQTSPNNSHTKTLLSGLAILVSFGFVVLILTSNFGRESIEDRAYMGDFSEETIQTRWANLEEVMASQQALVDPTKIDTAIKSLAGDIPAAAKSDIVVPGSPTFMKQTEAASTPPEPVTVERIEEQAKPSEKAGEGKGKVKAKPTG